MFPRLQWAHAFVSHVRWYNEKTRCAEWAAGWSRTVTIYSTGLSAGRWWHGLLLLLSLADGHRAQLICFDLTPLRIEQYALKSRR